MSIENDLQALKRIFIDYPKLFKDKRKELDSIEKERQDLLHALEFGNLNAVQQSWMAREIKQVSRKRRTLKNNLEVLEAISKFSHQFNNNTNKNKQIETVTNTVDRIVNRDRTYTMRVRPDLQELVDGR